MRPALPHQAWRATDDGADGGRTDRVVPLVLASALFAGLALMAGLRAYTLDGVGYDLAYFVQAAWLITHGEAPVVTIRGLHLLGDHFSPVYYPMAWLTAAVPTVPALLGLQSAALAGGVVPLWGLSRRVAGVGTAGALAVVTAYAAYPALHNVNLADFHPEVVAVPALLAALLFGFEERWWPFTVCALVALASREEMSIVVGFLGVLMVLEGKRRPGMLTVAAGAFWFALATQVVQPHFAGTFVPAAFLEQYGSGLGEIVVTMASDPARVLADLFTRQNGKFALAVLAPVAALPVAAPRYLLPVLPLEVLYLLSTREAAHTIEAQYTVALIPFVFLATAMALPRVARLLPLSPVLFVLVASAVVGHTLLANDSVLERPWRWSARDGVDRARLAAAELVPDHAIVSASDRMWPLLAERRLLYNFPDPFQDDHGGDAGRPRTVASVEYLVLDTVDGVQWTAGRERALEEVLARTTAEPVFDREGIVVYRLGPVAPPEEPGA